MTKVNAPSGKTTIEHQKFPNLEGAAMTMVFKASDPAVLKAVSVGDMIKFAAASVNGQLALTKVTQAK